MEGKVVLITGASSGMGKASALYLAQKGVKAITLFSRRKEALDETAKEIKEKFPSVQTLVVAGDVASAADNQRAVDETVKAFGCLHGAFLNAGVYKGGAPLHEVPEEDIQAILDINVKGTLYGLKSCIPAIKKTVGDEGPTGSIVVNSSCMARAVIGPKSANNGLYSASKAFVSSLVETAAVENAPRIRVNAVLPGVVKTSLMPVDDETYDTIGGRLQPLWGKAAMPQEVGSLVGYLLSDEASFISGTNINVDGLWSKSGGSF
ncbi:Diacetyl reductase [(S)-acetoin forming] [Seminavis robusta]|uniref:Diacetyl reductase [(S)-acetoin forming] n=1 Tax=Seminavis robusta TaxID=568900 RepID=A0A9N8DVH2_9STRA|nr:Diacetyl reductase [(S)-acetoin forming] [Seminavis robusta]|eukprot:Sro324_g117490.1 Diacetyl reductase [(S)-acetoin forming] (263) ;mRNA; f:17325-18334